MVLHFCKCSYFTKDVFMSLLTYASMIRQILKNTLVLKNYKNTNENTLKYSIAQS